MSVISSLVQIKVGIEGLPPGLLFQGKGLMEENSGGKTSKPRPVEEEAELRAHWTQIGGKDQLCIPSEMIFKAICKAGSRYKPQGMKKVTMESILGSTITFSQEVFPLGSDKYEVFESWVRIPPRTGAMVKIGRPLIRKWSCEFVIDADCEVWEPDMLKEIINDAGKWVGIGAWRPQLKGQHGRFRVCKFSIVK